MQLIDGKKISEELLVELKTKISQLSRPVGLAVLLIGEDPASDLYVRMKSKTCARVGIYSRVLRFPEHLSQQELLEEIRRLNEDPSMDGILVQLPLPRHLDVRAVMNAIDPEKDVDGFHPVNMGKLLLGEEGGFIPCTPRGIHVLLKRSSIALEGKHVVIAGRSNLVGKPLAALLMQKRAGCNATVTVVHSRSKQFSELTRIADVLVAAIGDPQFIRGEMVKEQCVVIDVGSTLVKGRWLGDVDFASVAPKVARITPVPGGVGPMTVALLMQSAYESAAKKRE